MPDHYYRKELYPFQDEVLGVIGETGTWQNILANKISALGRDEAKDFADILFLAKRFPFQWQEMIAAAKKKDMWVNELAISEFFFSFAAARMADLHWIRPFAATPAERALKTIAADILHGRDNSLAKRKKL